MRMQDFLQSRLQVAGVYEFKFLRGDFWPSFLGIRWPSWALCCHTIVSLALAIAKLSGVSVMTGVTLVTHCPRADNTRTSAKYRKKDLDTKWILLLENEPVTRLQLLLSSRSLCVFKLSNNLNLLWKDWITGLILLDIMWQYPADFWSDPTYGLTPGPIGWWGPGHAGDTWTRAKGRCPVSGGWHGDMLHVITQVWLEWPASIQPRHL